MKKLIREFYDKISNYGGENYEYIVWNPSTHTIARLCDWKWTKKYIANFTKNGIKDHKISSKYFYYSSGMNNLKAYREGHIPIYHW
ncbi:MAG: hypothetical protein WD512_11765 [Candidatus Paceibacterota bacterium]